MGTMLRLTMVLAIVSAMAAGALAITYGKTARLIEEKEKQAREKALEDVFFKKYARKTTIDEEKAINAIYLDKDIPSYYTAIGKGIGYNTSVKMELLVGFTNPDLDACELLKGYVSDSELPPPGSKGLYVVGFKVVKSEETPGLGEKAKESEAPFTWAEIMTGTAGEPGDDRGTAFQKQFRGKTPQQLILRKDGGTVDVITAATYSTNGIIEAIKDAAAECRKIAEKTRK